MGSKHETNRARNSGDREDNHGRERNENAKMRSTHTKRQTQGRKSQKLSKGFKREKKREEERGERSKDEQGRASKSEGGARKSEDGKSEQEQARARKSEEERAKLSKPRIWIKFDFWATIGVLRWMCLSLARSCLKQLRIASARGQLLRIYPNLECDVGTGDSRFSAQAPSFLRDQLLAMRPYYGGWTHQRIKLTIVPVFLLLGHVCKTCYFSAIAFHRGVITRQRCPNSIT